MQYYSDKTKKLYQKKEELFAAEKEYDKAHALEVQKANEKKARAKEVEVAAQACVDIKKEYSKQRKELETAFNKKLKEKETQYYELRNKFVEDYGSYHSSVTNVVNLQDILDQIFSW